MTAESWKLPLGNSAIASSDFADIFDAGGTFVTGGYSGAITDEQDPPSQQSPW